MRKDLLFVPLLILSCTSEQGQSPRIPPQAHLETSKPGETTNGASLWLGLLVETMAVSPKENILISPASLDVVLGMLYHAALSPGADEIHQVFWPSRTKEGIAPYHASLSALLNPLRKGDSLFLSSRSALWHAQDVKIRNEYRDLIQMSYNGIISVLPAEPDRAKSSMQSWIQQSLDGIPSPPVPVLPPGTQVALLNAMSLRGKWQVPFDKSRTQAGSFQGASTQALFMHLNSEFRYRETEAYQAVSLPMKGPDLSFILILPAPGHTVSEIARLLATEGAELGLADATMQPGTVEMPRLKITFEMDWSSLLATKGIRCVFDPGEASLGHLTPKPEGLSVGAILQGSAFEADEEGVAGSAISLVAISDTARADAPKPFRLRAERPFLLAVEISGTLLFLGVVADPTAGG